MGNNHSKISKEENKELLRGNINNRDNYDLRVKGYTLIILFHDYCKTISSRSLFKTIIFSYIYNNKCIGLRRILNNKRAEQILLRGSVQ